MNLRDVPPENEFVLISGRKIKNVVELGRELRQMTNKVFAHHVTEQKNDFANWIEACVEDERLGTLVRTTKDKERMAAIVERRIKELTQPPRTKQPVKQTMPLPSIVRTKNVTMLKFAHEQPPVQKIEQQPPRQIIHTPHKTVLKLQHEQPVKTEIYVHEVNKHHHGAALLLAHLVLGIVVGVAIAALVLAFNT